MNMVCLRGNCGRNLPNLKEFAHMNGLFYLFFMSVFRFSCYNECFLGCLHGPLDNGVCCSWYIFPAFASLVINFVIALCLVQTYNCSVD